MRSAAELKFRLRQELSNLYLAATKPQLLGPIPATPFPFPAPQSVACALHGTLFEFTVLATAQNILAHRFPLLGFTLETGPQIDWRRDYVNHKTSAPAYFRRVNYLSFEAVGDHKFIWELSRHQHLVLLAQAHLLTGKPEFLTEVFAELESWLEQNPFQHGINWTSALEVAFRALSWIWLWYFCRESMPPALLRRFLTSLYQHGRYLSANLSIYFSANTHLLGEAVALHAIGTIFPEFRHAQSWKQRGAQVVEEQLAAQIKPDGSHFEQSTYYHVYAVDFFVFYYLLAGKPARLEPALINMAEYLHWLLGPARRIAYFGDDDGGRLFHPQGKRDEFGRATLATCGLLFDREEWIGNREDLAAQAAWLLPSDVLSRARQASTAPQGSKHFQDAGAIFLQSKEIYVQFDAGPLGWAGAGHSHADTLSFVLWLDNELVLTDPGTFTYLGNPTERERFRATASHNTVTINGLSQADPAGPFRWANKPQVQLHSFVTTETGGTIDASCEYHGFIHRRRLTLDEDSIVVVDEISGPPGEHRVQQLWNLGPAASQMHFSFSEPSEEIATEFSPAYGLKVPARALFVKCQAPLPISLNMTMTVRRMFNNEVSNSRTS